MLLVSECCHLFLYLEPTIARNIVRAFCALIFSNCISIASWSMHLKLTLSQHCSTSVHPKRYFFRSCLSATPRWDIPRRQPMLPLLARVSSHPEKVLVHVLFLFCTQQTSEKSAVFFIPFLFWQEIEMTDSTDELPYQYHTRVKFNINTAPTNVWQSLFHSPKSWRLSLLTKRNWNSAQLHFAAGKTSTRNKTGHARVGSKSTNKVKMSSVPQHSMLQLKSIANVHGTHVECFIPRIVSNELAKSPMMFVWKTICLKINCSKPFVTLQSRTKL